MYNEVYITISNHKNQPNVREKDADLLWNRSSRQRDFNRPPFTVSFRACIVLNWSRFSSFHNANLEPRNVQFIAFAQASFIAQDACIQTYAPI